ncbi:transposase [Patescibacteria group bacterium]|nr:transposase [Patescibacteria group bacterium]
MRKIKITPGEYYHIYNRGNNKQDIFLDNRDRIRFLFLILFLQSLASFPQIGRSVSFYVKHSVFDNMNKKIEKIKKKRRVKLINFSLMPNHFHLIIHELKGDGISQYMQRILNAYTKYFNVKYGKSGHLFQGPFQIVHIKNNEQLLHLSAYIHRNPREINEWKNKEHLYPWSSFQDIAKKNRWGDLLIPNILIKQFSNPKEYRRFVDTSGTKMGLDEKHLI